MKAIRDLQLFRNGKVIVGSVESVKQTVETMFSNGDLVLHDGEPISVRYRLEENSATKGLIGVAYVDADNAQNNKILWTEGGTVSIVTHPTEDDYVTLKYSYDPATNEYDLVADANVLSLDEACVCYHTVTNIYTDNLFADIRYYDEHGEYHEELKEMAVGDSVPCSYVKSWFKDNKGTIAAEPGVDFKIEESYSDGLAGACDVKGRIHYYDVVSGNPSVIISSQTSADSDGFGLTTFSVSLDTESLPSYTIGTTATTSGYLKTYALFKDGNLVANSQIDIPKDFLVRSASVIEVVEVGGNYYDETNDPQHTTPLTGVTEAGAYIDFVINVKAGATEPNEHIYIPVSSLADVYTAGDGISIGTTNVVSARISSDSGNQISISQTDGGLFVPAGETIVDVANITSNCESRAAEDPTYYGYYNGAYVVIIKTGSDPDTYTYNGQPYQGPVGGPVPCGHRYLVVRTSGGNMYMTNNDTSSDVHVSNFSIATNSNDEDVLRITMNDNTTYDVLVSDINPTIPEATVNWNTANDTLAIGTSGILTSLALGTIEAYIDNFDCGTF